MQSAHRFTLFIGLAALSVSSFAATTVYTTSASFLANVAPGSYTNTFTGLSSLPPSAYSSGGFSYTLAAPSGLYSNGDFLGTSLPNEALTISFTGSNVRAVGGSFYVTNFSDDFQSVAVTLTLSDSTTVTFTPTAVASSYRGFISTVPITSLTFSAPGASLYAGVDNLTVGAVPEPATALLMALGAAGLLIARQRRA